MDVSYISTPLLLILISKMQFILILSTFNIQVSLIFILEDTTYIINKNRNLPLLTDS